MTSPGSYCHRHVEETTVASYTSQHPACGYTTARQQDRNKSTNLNYRNSTKPQGTPAQASHHRMRAICCGPLDSALPPLLCHKAEFSVMLTYNTAYDLPGPSRLQLLMHSRFSCASNRDKSNKRIVPGGSAHYVLPSHPPVPSARLTPPFALSLQVCSSSVCKKNSPKTPEDVDWHEALCSGFSASACARWRWREPSGSAPLLADAASGMLLKRGLTVRAFIP